MDWEKLKPSRMGFFDEALMQVPYDGAKNVVCPMCGTLIQVDAIGNSRDVHCQMKDCFCLEEFDTRRFLNERGMAKHDLRFPQAFVDYVMITYFRYI